MKYRVYEVDDAHYQTWHATFDVAHKDAQTRADRLDTRIYLRELPASKEHFLALLNGQIKDRGQIVQAYRLKPRGGWLKMPLADAIDELDDEPRARQLAAAQPPASPTQEELDNL